MSKLVPKNMTSNYEGLRSKANPFNFTIDGARLIPLHADPSVCGCRSLWSLQGVCHTYHSLMDIVTHPLSHPLLILSSEAKLVFSHPMHTKQQVFYYVLLAVIDYIMDTGSCRASPDQSSFSISQYQRP